MTTKVFCYKGFLGMLSSHDATGLLNNPQEDGFFRIEPDHVEISAEALEALKNAPVGETSDDWTIKCEANEETGKVEFAWVGFDETPAFEVSDITVTSNTNFDIFTASEVETPADFIQFVDAYIADNAEEGE